MVDAWIPYGKTEVCARIPTRNFLGYIEPKERVGVADPKAEIERALSQPIGTQRLSEIAKEGDQVAIKFKFIGSAGSLTVEDTWELKGDTWKVIKAAVL